MKGKPTLSPGARGTRKPVDQFGDTRISAGVRPLPQPAFADAATIGRR